MSRLVTLSPQALKAMFSTETDEQLITLLTIQNPANPNAPVLLADGYVGRLTALTTDEEVVYGVESRGKSFLFLPLEISMPSEEEAGVGRCSITLNYVTKEAIQLIRTQLTNPTQVTLELVLASSPNVVEASFPGFFITGATYNAESIGLELDMIDFTREPFPCYNFTPNYFPGLF
jgi:hypothetical protein